MKMFFILLTCKVNLAPLSPFGKEYSTDCENVCFLLIMYVYSMPVLDIGLVCSGSWYDVIQKEYSHINYISMNKFQQFCIFFILVIQLLFFEIKAILNHALVFPIHSPLLYAVFFLLNKPYGLHQPFSFGLHCTFPF